ncbi:hypothetical protein OG413_45090 [Streptomyces sp. NBC_01433]|uniref:hypothetical protein n=1 Tax=Streptomyces sp. NBC_01433 TaxID=2903864 RepID=UPI002252D3DF|nr:hypothetical protein [Streptomyces sp. NBC_01433]MCX4682362.1 hypothetical protein [Streptomyces sp. NBC_01433]
MLQIDQREALARYEQELAGERRRRQERERELWERIIAAAPFALTVRTDARSVLDVPLRHAAAAIDLLTGDRRQHPAGRALCEGITHTHLMPLSEPVDAYATCHRCVHAAAVARPADGPEPPTRRERRELERVEAGAVFTVEHTEGPEIRDTSEQSRSPGGDQGRMVTAVMKRLHARGWVERDAEATDSLRGGCGWRWNLTSLGAAALALPAVPRWVEATPSTPPQHEVLIPR